MKTIATILLFCSIAAHAMPMADLYQVQLQVPDDSAATRVAIFPQALQQVLLKVSGNLNMLNSPIVKSNLANPDPLVESFSYAKKNIANNNTLWLTTKFSPKAIREILAKTGQLEWNQNRPLTLVWLIIKDGNPPILTNNENNYIASLLQIIAQNKGTPILFPILDLEDLSKISLDDVNSKNLTAIMQATARYNPDLVLIGNINHDNNNWTSSWTLNTKTESISWNNMAASLNQLIDEVTNQLATELALRITNINRQNLNQQVTLLITGVNDLETHNAIMNYLRNLNFIAKTELTAVEGNSLTVQITSQAGEENLMESLATDNKLTLVSKEEFPTATNVDLIYNWNA